MLNKISKVKPYSLNPRQDFMWVAEYLNGTLSHEFEKEKFEVDRSKLLNFGLVGLGLNCYYDVPTGAFNFDGKKYEFILKQGEKEYNLTNQMVLYNDCIHFHRYFCDMNGDRAGQTFLCGYQLGYKIKYQIEDVFFNFQPLFIIEEGQPFKFRFRLVVDKDFEGEFIIRTNGLISDSIKTNLKANINSQFEWLIYR
jgi:hypothetical protein